VGTAAGSVAGAGVAGAGVAGAVAGDTTDGIAGSSEVPPIPLPVLMLVVAEVSA